MNPLGLNTTTEIDLVAVIVASFNNKFALCLGLLIQPLTITVGVVFTFNLPLVDIPKSYEMFSAPIKSRYCVISGKRV